MSVVPTAMVAVALKLVPSVEISKGSVAVIVILLFRELPDRVAGCALEAMPAMVLKFMLVGSTVNSAVLLLYMVKLSKYKLNLSASDTQWKPIRYVPIRSYKSIDRFWVTSVWTEIIWVNAVSVPSSLIANTWNFSSKVVDQYSISTVCLPFNIKVGESNQSSALCVECHG